jgi:four helix bundle protein
MRNFRKLNIWNQGIDLAVRAYEICKHLPKEELYGLRSQMTRAAISIPSNIAEGSSRESERDFKRFLEISLGSCFELETDLILAEKLGFIKSGLLADFFSDLTKEQKQLNNLISKIKEG